MRVTKAAALVLTLAHRPDPPVVIAPAGITTPRFRVPVFPCRLGPAHRGITTPRFRVSVPEGGPANMGRRKCECRSANPPGDTASVEGAPGDARVSVSGFRKPPANPRPTTMANPPGRLRPAKCARPIANVEVRMSKCESARRHCECRFPIAMGESARRSVPANPPGEVSRPIAMGESARLAPGAENLQVSKPPPCLPAKVATTMARAR